MPLVLVWHQSHWFVFIYSWTACVNVCPTSLNPLTSRSIITGSIPKPFLDQNINHIKLWRLWGVVMWPFHQFQSHVESGECLCKISLLPDTLWSHRGNTAMRFLTAYIFKRPLSCVIPFAKWFSKAESGPFSHFLFCSVSAKNFEFSNFSL